MLHVFVSTFPGFELCHHRRWYTFLFLLESLEIHLGLTSTSSSRIADKENINFPARHLVERKGEAGRTITFVQALLSFKRILGISERASLFSGKTNSGSFVTRPSSPSLCEFCRENICNVFLKQDKNRHLFQSSLSCHDFDYFSFVQERYLQLWRGLPSG